MNKVNQSEKLKSKPKIDQQLIDKYSKQNQQTLVRTDKKCEPYKKLKFQLKKNKITTVYQNLDESEKNSIQSKQFDILKSIQETLNQRTKSYYRNIIYEDEYIYKGDYKYIKNEIILDGFGILKWRDQVIYEGQFLNNKFHGNGIIKQDNKLYNLLDWRRNDQNEIKGIFENGILIGEQNIEK